MLLSFCIVFQYYMWVRVYCVYLVEQYYFYLSFTTRNIYNKKTLVCTYIMYLICFPVVFFILYTREMMLLGFLDVGFLILLNKHPTDEFKYVIFYSLFCKLVLYTKFNQMLFCIVILSLYACLYFLPQERWLDLIFGGYLLILVHSPVNHLTQEFIQLTFWQHTRYIPAVCAQKRSIGSLSIHIASYYDPNIHVEDWNINKRLIWSNENHKNRTNSCQSPIKRPLLW